MNLVALPAFTDNTIRMLHDGAQAVVVDPGDAAVVQAALDTVHVQLRGILVTHHHPDHAGGVDELRARRRGPAGRPARECIPEPFESDSPAVIEAAPGQGATSDHPVAVPAALRPWKYRFR